MRLGVRIYLACFNILVVHVIEVGLSVFYLSHDSKFIEVWRSRPLLGVVKHPA